MTTALRANGSESGDASRREHASAARAGLEELAELAFLRSLRLYGQGVAIALLDDGVHADSVRAKLRAAPLMDHGAQPLFEVQHSRVAGLAEPFSRSRRSHGSMCAYDACLGAPGCTLLDFPVLAPRAVGGRRLDFMLAAYRRVVESLRAGVFRHIVVVNAWQTLPGDERLGVETDDPAHPLHRALCELDAAGADVLFAAPDHHAKQIHGPALHPRVLTVTAVNLDGTPFESSVERVRPDIPSKPDVSNYQGFAGYELFRNQADYGTSAATALTAGLMAAVRSAPRARRKSPAELRELFRQSATQREVAGRPGPMGPSSGAAGPGIVDIRHVFTHL
jgi:hypothetical protein